MKNAENIKRIKDAHNDFLGEFKNNIVYGYCKKCHGLQPMAKVEKGIFYIFHNKQWTPVEKLNE